MFNSNNSILNFLTRFGGIIFLLVFPFLVGNFFGNSWVRSFNYALLYIMLAIGLNMIVGYAGLLNLGFIAFYAIGAYTYALLCSPQFGLDTPWYIALLISAASAGIIGGILAAPVLRLRGDYLAIVTLGFGEIVRIFLNNMDALTNGAQGIDKISPVKIAGVSFDNNLNLWGLTFKSSYLYFYLFLAILLVIILFCKRLQNSKIGRAWMAMREDEIVAQAMGINLSNMKILAFSLGTLSAGVAGGLFAAMQSYISPESFTLNQSIIILTMIVLGGMGNINGVIIGALLLTFTPEILREWVEPFQQAVFKTIILPKENAIMLLFGISMVVMMILCPDGILPVKNQRKVKLKKIINTDVNKEGANG